MVEGPQSERSPVSPVPPRKPTGWQHSSPHQPLVAVLQTQTENYPHFRFFLFEAIGRLESRAEQSVPKWVSERFSDKDFLEQLFNLECLVSKTPELGESH